MGNKPKETALAGIWFVSLFSAALFIVGMQFLFVREYKSHVWASVNFVFLGIVGTVVGLLLKAAFHSIFFTIVCCCFALYFLFYYSELALGCMVILFAEEVSYYMVRRWYVLERICLEKRWYRRWGAEVGGLTAVLGFCLWLILFEDFEFALFWLALSGFSITYGLYYRWQVKVEVPKEFPAKLKEGGKSDLSKTAE